MRNVAGPILCSGCTDLHCKYRQGILPCKGWGVTASQLELSSLTPLSVAGCGRLQVGVAHCATLVDPTNSGSIFSFTGLLAIKDCLFKNIFVSFYHTEKLVWPNEVLLYKIIVV